MRRIYEKESALWDSGTILFDRAGMVEETEKIRKMGAKGTAFGKSVLGDIFLMNGKKVVMWDTEINAKAYTWDSVDEWLKAMLG